MKKRDNTDIMSDNFAKVRIDSFNSLAIENTLTFDNVIILIKSVASKNQISRYYNLFLEKGSHEDKSNTQYF